MIVDWQIYYDAAEKCHRIADDLRTADKPVHDSIKQKFTGMAGTAPGCKQWGEAYDDAARRTMQACASLANALTNYAAVLYAQGYNWGIANKSNPPPSCPNIDQLPEYKVIFPSSVGGNRTGFGNESSDKEFRNSLSSRIQEEFWILPNPDPELVVHANEMWLQFSASAQLTSVSPLLSGVASHFNDIDDAEIRQRIRDTLGTLRSSAERVMEASKQLATGTQNYWEATRSFGKLAAREVKRQGETLGVAAEEDFGDSLFKVWTTHDPDPDRIPQAVEATLQGIQDGFSASDLSVTLGMGRLSAHATGNIAAFDGIDELDTTIRDLSGIIAMKAILIDAGTCGGPVGPTTSGGPTNEVEVKDYLKSHTDKGKNPPNRQVATDEEMVQLYNELTKNGTSVDPGTYPGRVSRLPDGTELRMRDDSLSGGRTIDIKYPSGKVWKVHLAKS